jgi:type IV pilus assembly protein PilV
MFPSSSARTMSGFSLVEVMVAVVIICIGMLGIAKIEALALSNTAMSSQRAFAAIEAASLASAMHSNRSYWNQLPVSVTITLNNAAANPVAVDGDSVLQSLLINDMPTGWSGGTPSGGNLTACIGTAGNGQPACAPTNLAAYDLARWWSYGVFSQLPNPTAVIQCLQGEASTQGPQTCTIQIQWFEKSVAVNVNEANAEEAAAQSAAASNSLVAASASEIPTFTLYVQP